MSYNLSRRRFLKASSGALALAAISPLAVTAAEDAAAAGKKRSLKNGIMYQTVHVRGTVLEKFKAI